MTLTLADFPICRPFSSILYILRGIMLNVHIVRKLYSTTLFHHKLFLKILFMFPITSCISIYVITQWGSAHLRHYLLRQCFNSCLFYYLVVLDLPPDLVMSWAQSIYKRSQISPQFRFLLFSQNQNHYYHHHLSPLSPSPYLYILPILI